MEKLKYIEKIKNIYSAGGNIIKYLKSVSSSDFNSVEDILISYDLQAGNYIKGFSRNQEFKHHFCNALATEIESFGSYSSIMEAGIGEGTTIGVLLKHLNKLPAKILGFDVSYSRLKFAQEFLADYTQKPVQLFVANLFDIPLLDNSVDIVYTAHSIEPNGGREKDALQELYRVTGKYLVLLEPSYEFANQEARERMKEHGYVTNLFETAKALNYNVLAHRLFDYSANPLNPTGLIIIKKEPLQMNAPQFVCPVSQTPLTKYSDSLLYSQESFLAYPVIDNIPCLLKENSILASHLLTDYQKFKDDNKLVFESL
jgi:ubiquinone/menaquinone biosynthesis C-methylase UbiE/uncharacterized protein YbaR (Trm112 family)